ncbi:helix-turn-helix domain-containing protein [Mesonia oceanica]|uniref:HTH-type transcriptional activator Btr n=2 Tax=Flavobacteriaceae TaxID=49546 RepID=A0AC61YAW4_9FLAO|nr:helix-turn-helix domain-containing protein [Mesonia oceanica]MAQ41398.1 AraC family transcriptional regulator [Mesonia sp.]MBJ98511.1 AraC family transcriptional regulator [Flavobacteriaceae bacterium]VVV00500.1 HTH-type transcriptional activator Btr [Mesonia oceanica]HCV81653.1 AraC family transcriptional regulator [Zunongwangia profunda]|tara:strand:- start:7338 stop:8228 length:891 start_codon:yes stop_codon:yes gene_type:complete
MTPTVIPVYETSNDLNEAMGFPHRSHIPNFDVYSLERLEPSSRRCMPPYRQGFYQIGLLSYVGESKLNLNTDWLTLEDYPLWFVVPGQVFSWVRDEKMAGFNIMFRKEFLMNVVDNVIEDFPFLKMSERSLLMLTKEEHDTLYFDAQRILSVFQNPHPYQEKMLEGMLVSFLYYCKAVYERYKSTENHLTRAQVITQKFEILVDKMYVDTKNVSDYAEKLNITPNYLTTTVKKLTGKSAKDIIQERLLLESKSLLKFSGLDVGEIAYRLNFQEPTHFTRFFKKWSGTTPNKFRQSE